MSALFRSQLVWIDSASDGVAWVTAYWRRADGSGYWGQALIEQSELSPYSAT